MTGEDGVREQREERSKHEWGEDNDVNFNGREEGEREKAGLQREMEEKRRGGVRRM